MRGIIAFIVSSIAGGVGWWIGARVGIMTASTLSAVATGAGIYYARRWCDEHLP